MPSSVDEYIEKQTSPQKEIMQTVRAIFKHTLPQPKEKMKWGYIIFGAGKFYLVTMKTCVHVGFAISELTDSEIRLF
jgi:uncharacterized protein YdhG (YjbR/CyaY superfamily)